MPSRKVTVPQRMTKAINYIFRLLILKTIKKMPSSALKNLNCSKQELTIAVIKEPEEPESKKLT
jgi:hypothetical protein